MNAQLLVTAEELAAWLADGEAVVFDCRFDLMHPDQGHHSWLAAHIPGAVYAHLDNHLSGRVTRHSGRHPLPLARSFAAFLGRSGWTPEKRTVAYDSQGGAIASRLWWLMNYFGLGGTSLLDGGINAWMTAGLTLESGTVRTRRQPAPELRADPAMTIDAQGVISGLEQQQITLIDARATARFRGEVEPIDTIGGHVPGAHNFPVDGNLEENNRFRSPQELSARFKPVASPREPERVVSMCGSGVTACQNLFALELAGLGRGRLYVGSWSEWIRDPSRPVLQGATR
jgi:thiosulfate/3-mercaptopyruvate sulfurtransferase